MSRVRVRSVKKPTIGAHALLVAGFFMLAACGGSTTTQTRGPNTLASDGKTSGTARTTATSTKVEAATVKDVAAQYARAKSAGKFGVIWDLMAAPSRRLAISVSKAPAEADDTRARLQGFDSADHVKSLDDRSYFEARRAHQAKQGQYSYKSGITLLNVVVGSPVYVPFPTGRLYVYPATLKLSDGSTDLIGVTEHAGRVSIVEP